MSLIQSQPLTISTYDPPSTPIALKAQDNAQNREPGRRLGTALSGRKSELIENEYLENLKNTTQTPPVSKKVLPWINEVVTEGYVPPEGMFGPYDSRPPTRHQPHPSGSSPQAQRSVHPFAYNAQDTLPLSALASEINVDKVLQEQFEGGRHRESEVLSRGAGHHLGRPKGEGGSSVGMGTFGREASQDPVSSSEALPPVPPKSPEAQRTRANRKPPPESPDTVRASSKDRPSTGDRPGVAPDIDQPDIGANVKIHHDFPFSPAEALRKEAEAMARVEALERLMGATGEPHVPTTAGGPKGPRETYETTTSGPSFGHIFHRDGMPIPRNISYQQDGLPPGPNPAHLFHIPWGPTVGLRLSRPDILFEGPGALAAGVIGHVQGELSPIREGRDSAQRREDRSAYVETVEDDEEPGTVRGSKAPNASRLGTAMGPPGGTLTPPRTESGGHSLRSTPPMAASQAAPTTKSSVVLGESAPRNQSDSIAGKARAQTSHEDPAHHGVHSQSRYKATQGKDLASYPPVSKAPENQEHLNPQSAPAVPRIPNPFFGSIAIDHLGIGNPYQLRSPLYPRGHSASSGLPSMASQMPTQGTITPAKHATDDNPTRVPSMTSQQPNHGSPPMRPVPLGPALSAASVISESTTPSKVKNLVADSKFHDDVLCQLLDAARLNLIGEEAKKALNRAARARVIELRDMREKGSDTDITSTARRSRDRKGAHGHIQSEEKKARRASVHSFYSESLPKPVHHRNAGQGHASQPPLQHGVQDDAPPQWARDIINRLSAFDERFIQLEKQATPERGGHSKEVTQDIPADLLNDLIFNPDRDNLGPSSSKPGDIHGIPFPLGAFGFPFPGLDCFQGDSTPHGGAFIQSIPSEQRNTNGTVLSWGSNADVELPAPDDRVSPPKTPKMGPPTINIQAPTESNIGKSVKDVSGSQVETVRPGQGSHHSPSVSTVTKLPMAAVPDPSERDLPPPPSESIRSHRPSPVSKSTQLSYAQTKPSTRHNDTHHSAFSERLGPNAALPYKSRVSAHEDFATVPIMEKPVMSSSAGLESQPTAYQTALQSLPPDGSVYPTNEKPTVDAPMIPEPVRPTPWDLVTQRLYSWAVVWEENTFSKAMEDISLNKQVGEFALTIFVMMTFKRMLKRNLSGVPHRACDKLFVPPTFAEAINQAVHAQQYKAAQQMLEELWYPFLFQEPPRVIIALTRHLNDPDIWIAHRFDLSTGHLKSYRVTHENKEHDGRPFRWWHAIKLAWPQYKIRDPMEMGQQTTTEWTTAETKTNNSLRALDIARNLFLGFRPEHPSDLAKLRESVWSEVKRLREKKRGGKLTVESQSPSLSTGQTGMPSNPR